MFIADTGKEVFVWIGGGASPDEKKNAMTYAHVSRVSRAIVEAGGMAGVYRKL